MANSPYEGLTPDERKIINESLQTPQPNWSNIAREIQDDWKKGTIGIGQTSLDQEVARLDRLIVQNLQGWQTKFPEYSIDGSGGINFKPVERAPDRSVQN